MKNDTLLLDNQSYKIRDGHMEIPIKPEPWLKIPLCQYVLKALDGMKLGSITITPTKLIIAYSKEVKITDPERWTGIDRNLENATSFDGEKFMVYNLKKANEIVDTYKTVKSNFKRNDARIRKKIFSKYGKKQRDRVNTLLHRTSKKIASQNNGVFMENLKGIRRLYRKGNGQGKKYRGGINTWSFYELQRQIEYKSRWNGLPVNYVKAHGTSSKCAECGGMMKPRRAQNDALCMV